MTVLITRPSSQVTMPSGWSTLVSWDNKLQAGDVYVFELIKSDDDILKVSIKSELIRCFGTLSCC